MNGWKQICIGDLINTGAAEVQTGPFGTQLAASQYVEHGIPVINVRNIGTGRLADAKLEYVNEDTAYRLGVHRLKEGDIVFGRKGAVERHLLVPESMSGWVQGSDCMRLRFFSDAVSVKFLSYYFSTSGHKDWMEAQCSFGATMSSLNQGVIRRIKLALPPLPVQRKIAAILSAYDDLIENNTRRIALLEKMAEEVYREWFVRLRFPGHEGVAVHQGVPEGWEKCPLSKLCLFNARSLDVKNHLSTINYVDISTVTTKNLGQPELLSLQEAPGRARRVVKHGDIIWSSVRPINRAYCLILNPLNNLIVSTGFVVITAKEDAPYTYLYALVTDDAFVEHMASVAKGSAYLTNGASEMRCVR